MKITTLIVTGLWFSPHGEMSNMFATMRKDGFATIVLTGVETLKERINIIRAAIQGYPTVTKIIAHSGACPVVVEALREPIDGRLIDVVLLNPAPLPGTMFDPFKDAAFWATGRYLFKMLFRKRFKMSNVDFTELLGLNGPEELKNLTEDSSSYIFWNTVVAQWKFWYKPELGGVNNLKVVTVADDRIIGSTIHATVRRLQKACKDQVNARFTLIPHAKGGHFNSMRMLKHDVTTGNI